MAKRSSKSSYGGKVHESAQLLGHLGGVKGGPARAKVLSPHQRSSIAQKGGIAKAKKS